MRRLAIDGTTLERRELSEFLRGCTSLRDLSMDCTWSWVWDATGDPEHASDEYLNLDTLRLRLNSGSFSGYIHFMKRFPNLWSLTIVTYDDGLGVPLRDLAAVVIDGRLRESNFGAATAILSLLCAWPPLPGSKN